GRGFQRWYGFHGGETHQYVPSLYQDNHAVRPPVADEYHLSTDLADTAIRYLGELRSAEPEKPFLLYFATGACHSPHHAPPAFRERYRGKFDGGGMPGGRRRSVGNNSSGCSRRRPSCRRVRRGCRRGTPWSRRTRRSPPASWSASPASCRTPTSRSAGCSTSC